VKNWHVSDGDAVGMNTGRKELAVTNGTIGIIIEYTTYTGSFSRKGYALASRVCEALNAADTHSSQTEAGQDERGNTRINMTLTQARQRARAVGFKGKEADALARKLIGQAKG
jgi:hypothetical protein